MFDLDYKKKVVVLEDPTPLQDDPGTLLELLKVVSDNPRLLLVRSALDYVAEAAIAFEALYHEGLTPRLSEFLLSTKPSKGIKLLNRLDVLKYVFPELAACAGIEQHKEHHSYDVLYHLLYTCDYMPQTIVMRLAGLLHDIGKPQVYDAVNLTFHKHEIASTKVAKEFMRRFGYEPPIVNNVAKLVRHHMYNYDREWKDATVRKFIRKVGITKDDLADLDSFPLFVLRQKERLANDFKSDLPITRKQLDFQNRIIQILNQD